MTNIILSGCNGHMGKTISGVVSQAPDLTIVLGFDAMDQSKTTYPVYSSPADCESCFDADVIIDFSHPSCLEPLLAYAKKFNVPIVVSTTGLSTDQIKLIKDTTRTIPVFFSANMSLGVALVTELAISAARFLGEDFDIEIIEKHHNQKLDAPSGTALAIADAISNASDNNFEYVYDRHSVRKKRGKNEIGIHAVRGGNIVGEHSVLYAGKSEFIEINHCATSKEVFAAGAVRAAKFMAGKQPGLYDMKSIIKEL